MAGGFERKPPLWFWLVTVLLLLWEVIGIWAWWAHVSRGAYGMEQNPTAYDIAYFAALPGWYAWLYATAVFTALAGALLLLARRREARPIYLVSVIATAAMFAWNFLATDLIAAKGTGVVYFPALIVAIGLFAWWWAGFATRRGWLR